MAVPKRKTSKTRRDTRRNSHWKLTMPGMTPCPQCKEFKLTHRVCTSCGFYNGKAIVVKKEA